LLTGLVLIIAGVTLNLLSDRPEEVPLAAGGSSA
jgi:hypothetical protein